MMRAFEFKVRSLLQKSVDFFSTGIKLKKKKHKHLPTFPAGEQIVFGNFPLPWILSGVKPRWWSAESLANYLILCEGGKEKEKKDGELSLARGALQTRDKVTAEFWD